MALNGPGPAGSLDARSSDPGGRRPARSPRRRVWRWLVAIVLGVGVLVFGAVLALWFVLGSLNRPWLKSRIIALVQSEAGLGIDYSELEISLGSGIQARSLRLLSPPRFAAAAEDFVRIDDFSLRARLWAFAIGERSIEALHIGRLSLAVVRDEHGNTSLTELFPSPPDTTPSAPLSQALGKLPSITLTKLDVDEIEARLVELGAAAPARGMAVSGIGLHGAVESGPEGLAGTNLRLAGAPALRLELQQPERTSHAELGVDVELHAVDPSSLGLRAALDLRSQDALPAWVRLNELLRVEGTVHFQPEAQKTLVSISGLRALDRALALDANAELFDAPPGRVLASGKGGVHLGALPPAVDGLALERLDLDLNAEKLDWDGAHIQGALGWDGHLRGLALDRPEGTARVDDLALTGKGSFDGRGGSFQAQLTLPTLRGQAPELGAALAGVSFTLKGTTSEPSGVQRVDAEGLFEVKNAQLRTSSGQDVSLDDASLRTRLQGSVADLAARAVPELASSLAIARLSSSDRAQTTRLERLSATCSIQHLVTDANSASGLQGAANLALSLPSLSVLDTGKRRAAKGRAALSVNGIELRAALPLSLARATGTFGVATVKAPGNSLAKLGLDFELENPLGWTDAPHPGAPNPGAPNAGARALVKGTLGSFGAGTSRGSLEELRLLAERPDADRYRLELDATGASLVAGGAALPGRILTEVRADANPSQGSVNASLKVHTNQGASAELKLDAGFARDTQRLHYHAEAGAEKLESLAAVLAGVAPSAANLKWAGARLQASADGDFTGVLHAAGTELPAPTPDPIATARGSEKLTLTLQGLDYRTPERTLVIPELSFDLDSKHGAEGAGQANASLRAKSLRLEGGGTSVRLTDLDQKLSARFDRAPDQGVVEVHAALDLGSAAQSFLPAYPVQGVHLASEIQIDHLHSIFLRSLSFDNTAAGTKLSASGALELRTESTPTGGKAIVGREALTFEGRLDQTLEPLARLGVAQRASGTVAIPFRLESGGLLGYRFVATLEANQVSFEQKDRSLAVEHLNGVIPIVEEFALLPSGLALGDGPRVSPLSDTRFFDVHPFLTGDDYVTVDSITFAGLQTLGPLAANVRIERTDFLIDQLQAGYRGGQIVGQARVAYRDNDPIVRLRVNVTGLRSGKGNDVFDANTALTFVPRAMTLDGKVQIVRASRGHLLDILDVLDPFHESANANRVRQGLAFGYPKFVRFQLHDGAVDTKVELGGLAQFVRIDEIKAVPLGPILQRYVAPALSPYLQPGSEKGPLTSNLDDEKP